MKLGTPGISRRVAVAAFSVVAAAASAQTNLGSIRGLVTDQQNSIIPNATIVLTNSATKLTRTEHSNNSGEYTFPSLDPGVYTVSVQAPNFRSYDRKNVEVASQQTMTVDVSLAVGIATETIEVSSVAPLIDNASASNGQAIDMQKLQTLPNAGRNPFLFAKLDTAVIPVGDPRFVRFQDQSGSSNISIAGGPLSTNNYLIDGIPITDTQNRAVIIPSLEAVTEVKVQSNTYDGEMGRTGGGMFNTSLQSGGASFHGVLQGETRQTNWNANSFFNNRTALNIGTTTFPTTPRGASEFYSYVGAIGGPIPLPKFLGGSGKTFFWMSEEGYRQRSPLGNSSFVPSDLDRIGDFSQDRNAAGTPLPIYDPNSANGGAATTRKQYSVANGNAGLHNGVPTDNVIPTANLNPVGLAIAAIYPHANIAPAGTQYGLANFYSQDTLGDRADEASFKLDHEFFPWWHASAHYLHYGSKEPGGNVLGVFPGTYNSGIQQGSYLLYRKVDETGVNSTFTISPTTVAFVGFGFNRFPNNTLDLSQGYDQTKLGLPASYVSQLQKKAFPLINSGITQNLAQLGTGNSGPASFYSRNFISNVQKSLGKHELKVGYVYRSLSVAVENISSGNGAFTFDNSYTSSDGSKTTASGADAASLVLGFPSTGTVSQTTYLYGNIQYNAGFIQDDWRILPRLTLNVGFRYEYEPGISERSNHTAVGFDQNVTYAATGTAGGSTFKGGVELAGQNGYGTHCCNAGSKYAPRVGLAYAPTNTTTVRAGFGIYNAPFVYTSANLGAQSPGYTQTTTYSPVSVGVGATAPLSNPFPAGIGTPSTSGLLTGVGSSVSVISQDRRAPLVQQFSADIEQDMGHGILFKLGYIGARSRNLSNSENINQLPDQYLSMGTALLTKVANPYYQKGGVGAALSAATVPQGQLLLPFPQFTTVTESVSNGFNKYNALTVKVEKRFSHGFTVLTGYTWSSNWDNLWGASSSLNGGNNGPQDIYNLKPEYARAIDDIPNRFTVATTYELPFGRGKQFLGSHGRLLDLAIGGWAINDVTVIQNGAPTPVTQTNANSISGTFGIGGSSQRPNIIGPIGCGKGAPESRINNYITTAGFQAAPVYTYGNAPRTTNCYGPGYANNDISINKTFQASERVKLQFRAEALNAFNTPQFASIQSNSISSGNFGKINGQLGFSRLIQLGGRMTF